MTSVSVKISGTLFDVPADFTIQVVGGPRSFTFAPHRGVSLDKIWDAVRDLLKKILGFELPSLEDGPWSKLFKVEAGTTVTPTLWVTPSTDGKYSAYLSLDLSEPICIGCGQIDGPVKITFEPQMKVYAIYLGYDRKQGGLQFRAKVEMPTQGPKNGSLALAPPADKTQIVSYPFPVPAQSSTGAFKLKYFGLGQRVGPDPVVTGNDPLASIFDQLESELTGNDPAYVIETLAQKFYKPDRDWFIAADLLFRGWELRVLFNDPAMYGLEISAPMQPLTPFSGLLFEILYQKLGPNLGVYYGALTLPYFLRRIPLEGVILILPGFSIWVYTNGDFKVNVGWPVGPNSAGVQIAELVGYAGFYFAKLRSSDDPGAQPSVNYDPILEFGIGVMVYAGVQFSAGPFSAQLSVTLTATFQGLLAWQALANGDSPGILSKAPDHYWFAGTASLVVILQGSVDFAIIKASVYVNFSAYASAAFETGYSTQIFVSASVDVRVSVKIVFFTIHLSFSTSISHTFSLGSGPPASANGPLGPGLAIVQSTPPAMVAALGLAERMLTRHMPRIASAQLKSQFGIQGGTPTIDAYFVLQPTVVYDSPAGYQLVASLFVPSGSAGSPSSPNNATQFDLLIVLLVEWLVNNYSSGETWSARFAAVAAALGSGASEPGPQFGGFNGFATALRKFLANSLQFQFLSTNAAQPPVLDTAALLPMPEVLALTDNSGHQIDFNTFQPVPGNYPLAVDLYLENIGFTSQAPGAMRLQAVNISFSSYLFTDYFLMTSRNVINTLYDAAVQYEKEHKQQLESALRGSTDPLTSADRVSQYVADLGDAEFDYLMENLNYASIAGFGSRFLLNGLQLPDPSQIPPTPTRENMETVPALPLYVLSGQQFTTAPGIVTATLEPSPTAPHATWIAFPQGSPALASATMTLASPLPPMPNPQWQIGSPYSGSGIDFQTLPPVSPNQIVFNLKSLIAWKSPQGAKTLYPLPQPAQALAGVTPGMQVKIQEEAAGSPSSPASPPSLPGTAGLLIRTSIQQVAEPVNVNVTSPSSPSTGSPSGNDALFVPFVYQLGGTDEETRDLLYELLQQDLSNASITLLYPNGSVLHSDTLRTDVLLVKTNLSTLNQARSVAAKMGERMANVAAAAKGSPNGDWALLSDPKGFLRLLWEVSVVNAPGFFLYYETADGKGLPDEIFADTSQPKASPGGPNEPVPNTSGGTAEFEILVQFGKALPQVPVPPYANVLAIDSTAPSGQLTVPAFDKSDRPLLAYSPTYPAGDVGFQIRWLLPPVSPEPPVPVDNLYHLLQYSITAAGPYEQTIWSLPVGPTDGGENEPSLYTQTIAVYDFLKGVSPAVDVNRYAAINEAVTLAFRIVDIYGNPLPVVHQASLLPLYQDPLVGWNEWPGVTAAYYFDPGPQGQARLCLAAEFDPDGVVAPNGSPSGSPGSNSSILARWLAVQARYQLILDQLTDPNTTCTLTTSISGAESVGDPRPNLIAFARTILDEIAAIVASSPIPPNPDPVRVAFSFPYAWQYMRSTPQDITPLVVTITLSRNPSLVAPEAVKFLPSAVRNSYVLQPDLLVSNPSSPTVSPASGASSLIAFAARFELAFANFDLAGGVVKLAQRSGMDTAGSGGAAQVPELFAVRFGTSSGISFTPDTQSPGSPAPQPTYFALKPLLNRYWSGTVNGRTVTNADLDAWARQFLQAVDAFLSPQMAAAIAILENRHGAPLYDQLAHEKTRLAAAVPGGLTWIFQEQEGQGNRDAALQLLQQSMLTSLANAYIVSTVVQSGVNVNVVGLADSPIATAPPQLFGSIGTSAGSSSPVASPVAPSNQYTISSATLNIESGKQWLTSMVTVAQMADQKALTLPLVYQATFLQHDFGQSEGTPAYVPSSWLKFVLPNGKPLSFTICPQADIPIPNPFVPQPPSLVLQQTAPTPMPSPAGSPAQEIDEAFRWDYIVQIAHNWAFQDELSFTVTYNQPEGSRDLLASSPPVDELGAALGAFVEAYPSLSSQFPSITKEAYGQSSSPVGSPDQAVAVIQQFTSLVKAVADAWTAEPVSAMARPLAPETLVNDFKLAFREDMNGIVIGTLYGIDQDGQSEPVSWPEVRLLNLLPWIPTGKPKRSGKYWYFEHRFEQSFDLQDLNQIEFRFTALNIVRCQTAILEAFITRNAELVPGFTTREPFVFTTPTVSFTNPIIPIINRGALSPLASGVSLSSTIQSILTPIESLGANKKASLRIVAQYQFALSGPLYATSPILLADNQKLEDGSPSVANRLANEIRTWFLSEAGRSTRGATINLAITMFGTISGQQLPLVQLDQIPIEVPQNNPNWWS